MPRNRTHSACRMVWLLVGILVFASIIAGGCAAPVMEKSAWWDRRINIVWPPPPDPPRIRLIRVINGPQDVVSINSGAASRFFEFMTGSQAELQELFAPHSIAADGTGTLYVADPVARSVHIYRLGAREVTVVTEAGDRQLASPAGVALDAEGNLYVTDSGWGSIFKYDSYGRFIKHLDGAGQLKRPIGIAINSKGDKIVADTLANKLIVFDRSDTFKGTYSDAGPDESFNMPAYVAVDRQDNMYVTDTLNFTLRLLDSTGKFISKIGQIGDAPGYFARPKGVAVDSDRNIYVIDAILGIFQIFNQQGQLLLYVSQEGSFPGEVMLPSGLFIDRDDRIYVADTFNHRIQIFQYLKEGVRYE